MVRGRRQLFQQSYPPIQWIILESHAVTELIDDPLTLVGIAKD